jgi:LysM repeat protein
MNKRVSHALRNFLVGMALGLLILLVIGGAAFLILRDRGVSNPGPAVIIRAPQFGEQVTANQSMIVRAMAEDFRGVTRVELWVDQQLLSVQTSELNEGSTPYPLSYAWYPEQPGSHILIVRAYNSTGGAGQASVRVEALTASGRSARLSYRVVEGDTLGSIAARFGVTPEGIAAENPGVAEPLIPGATIGVTMPPTELEGAPAEETGAPEPLPGEEPPDPLMARPAAPLERLASILPGGGPSGNWIELEARSLEVDKDYDGVYCYYSLAGGATERVPADGYLEMTGERRWGIDAAMAGDRRRAILLPEGTSTFEVRGNCFGYRSTSAGGEAFDLGVLSVNHALAEADGTPVLKEVNGPGGWFRVEYKMRVLPSGPRGTPPRPGTAEVPPSGTLPAPSLTGSCDRRFLGDRWAVECQLAWTVPSDSRGVTPYVDGFLLLRNGDLIQTLPARGRWAVSLEGSYPVLAPSVVDLEGQVRIAGDWGDLPAPGETYDFQIMYYQGSPLADPPAGVRSLPSNIFTLTGDMWPGSAEVTVTVQALQVICIWADRDRIGLCMEGIGPRGYDSTGMPVGSCSDYCSGSPEDWGPGAYGGIDIQGERAVSIGYPIYSGGRYTFPPSFGTLATPTITLSMSPFQYLVIESNMWDYDVFYSDDPFCQGVVSISPNELQQIRDGAMPGSHVSEFSVGDGMCYLGYTVEVR